MISRLVEVAVADDGFIGIPNIDVVQVAKWVAVIALAVSGIVAVLTVGNGLVGPAVQAVDNLGDLYNGAHNPYVPGNQDPVNPPVRYVWDNVLGEFAPLTMQMPYNLFAAIATGIVTFLLILWVIRVLG